MGNFAVLSPELIPSQRVVCFESSDPGDLEARLQVFINELVSAAAEGFSDVSFTGSGDGLGFMATFHLSTGAPALPAGTLVRVYAGSGPVEFQRNAQAAIDRTADAYQIANNAVAGSATGARWMGFFIATIPS